MTEEFKAFRILLVPLALLVVFFIAPRMCSRKAPVSAEEQKTTSAAAAQTASNSGLHIEGTPAAPQLAKSSTFPPGLDAARIQYLVEIDNGFSSPIIVQMPKKYDAMDRVQNTLMTLRYIEKNPDGTINVTRDGVLNLNLTDNGATWSFPIAKRAFDAVTYCSRVEDDRYDATVSWHFDPNPVGVALKVDAKKMHSATAEFVGGGNSSWALEKWIAAPDSARS